MLLRASSIPLWNSSIPQPEHILPKVPKFRTCSEFSRLSSTGRDYYYYSDVGTYYNNTKKKKKKKKKKPLPKCMSVHGLVSADDEQKRLIKLKDAEARLFLSNSSGLKLLLEERSEVVKRSNESQRFSTELITMGGGGGGGGGRRGGGRKIGCGGNGGDENEDDSEYCGDDSSTDLYYKMMIDANPGNPLLLSNYARYLKEVRSDFLKAEEYCERAVMATPNDGNILSLYAELKWKIHKDPILAEHYFHESVKASPEDW